MFVHAIQQICTHAFSTEVRTGELDPPARRSELPFVRRREGQGEGSRWSWSVLPDESWPTCGFHELTGTSQGSALTEVMTEALLVHCQMTGLPRHSGQTIDRNISIAEHGSEWGSCEELRRDVLVAKGGLGFLALTSYWSTRVVAVTALAGLCEAACPSWMRCCLGMRLARLVRNEQLSTSMEASQHQRPLVWQRLLTFIFSLLIVLAPRF